MKNNNLRTIISIACTLICIACIILDYNIIAASFGLVAYFTSLLTTKFVTRTWQIYLAFLIALIAGYAMGLRVGFPFMALSLLSLTLMPGIRTLLFEQISNVEVGWFESVLCAVGIGFYVFGNMYNSNSWIGWAFPAPAILFGIFMAVGFKIDRNGFARTITQKQNIEIDKPAPEFTLPDEENNIVTLSDYKGKRHVLLVFVRGDWCPTCHIMLRAYEKFKDKFAEKNIILLAIGPDSVGVNREMVIRLGLDYKLLCDDKAQAAKAYGMLFQPNNNETKYGDGIPLPASFLVDINGLLLYTSDPRKPGSILRPETIFPIIEKLSTIA
ncbi:MAG TPA: peroxiredoxin-like family protein [Bacteroidia bacterium]|jgi:peroxiredoxin|nr:peroxiredoxin-like family protein [Bacteroidia bacterium]